MFSYDFIIIVSGPSSGDRNKKCNLKMDLYYLLCSKTTSYNHVNSNKYVYNTHTIYIY